MFVYGFGDLFLYESSSTLVTIFPGKMFKTIRETEAKEEESIMIVGNCIKSLFICNFLFFRQIASPVVLLQCLFSSAFCEESVKYIDLPRRPRTIAFIKSVTDS